MEKKPTKYYSTLQEKRLANYFGWSTVSASGARPFNPGDIKSENWLCECKTFTEPRDCIHIKKSVWEKLRNEAYSQRKRPVLFLDNGTQKPENTYAVFGYLPFESFDDPLDLSIRESEKQFSFSHSKVSGLLKSGGYGKCMMFKDCLIIMTVSQFKSHISELGSDG